MSEIPKSRIKEKMTAAEFKELHRTGVIAVKGKKLVAQQLLPEYEKMLNKKVKNATKVFHGDKKIADSKFEHRCKMWLDNNGIKYELQPKITLIPKTTDKICGATIRAVTWTLDFKVNDTYIDAKGFVTDVAKLKFKVFNHLFPHKIAFVKSIKELETIINQINHE